MSKDHSFDIVSEVNLQEVDNAVQQAKKELAQRFDFKGSQSSMDWDRTAKTITLKTENEYRLKALVDMIQTKCVKRNISLKSLQWGKIETGMVGGSIKQVVTLQSGIPSEKAKEISKAIRDMKIKVQPQIQGEQVRVQGPKIDDLQAVMSALRQMNFDVDLQFVNFR
ncbi:MAG: YajQ family cyclic di-GMP-binding protein [Candidatus Omnitrophica bacterium]|nr:YajQ family cyclic di-GMP-binding protein [Candidatus Omnitrophota bacterium]